MTEKIDGRKAVVTTTGALFSGYSEFANYYDYPESAGQYPETNPNRNLKDGDVVTLLVSGKHLNLLYEYPLWIIEAVNGEKYIIGERGLRIIDNETEGGESMNNVTEIDGVKYREVKRKAAVGEKIRTIRIGGAFSSIPPGSILVVEKVYQDGSGVRTPNWGYSHEEYVVLEPITEYPRVDIASEDVDLIVLQRKLNGLKRQQAEFAKQIDGLTDAFAKLAAKTVISQNKPKSRDDIVAQAKRDVAELQAEGRGGKHYSTGYIVDFVINRDKRTVVALLREPLYSTVIARGKAKAAPGDVFNSHIGRAIALRRALGLEVPTEYTNAPQPTEPRVGDVVQGELSGKMAFVERVEGTAVYGKYFDGTPLSSRMYKIFDDSREEVSA